MAARNVKRSISTKHRGLSTVYTVTEVGDLSQLMGEDSIFSLLVRKKT